MKYFMQIKQAILSLAFSSLFFMGCEGGYTKIHTLDINVSEAPEVHGANTNQAPHSASWRLTGKVNTSSKDEITDQVTSRGNSANVTYKLGGTDFSGKIDFLYKVDGFIFGSGLGFKDGIYHHFTLGTNLRNFEFGAFFGFYHQYDKIEYEASRCEYEYHLFSSTDETCSSSFYESVYRFNTAPFIGAYAGLIIDKFFINYSVSVYSPSVNIEENAPTLAAIATQYLTAGIRINKWIELSAGSTMTYMDTPHWHYGFTGGISFYAM